VVQDQQLGDGERFAALTAFQGAQGGEWPAIWRGLAGSLIVSRMNGRPVRVVLVDDHEMVLQGLKAMLARFASRVRVVGEAAEADEAERLVAGLDPDVVL
jgi:hypothetical protein